MLLKQPIIFKFKLPNFLQGGLLLYAGGIFFLYRFFLVMSIFIGQYTWTEHTAIVLQASVEQSRGTNSRTNIISNFEYSYEVNGTTYKSNVFAGTELSLGSFEAAKKFNVGQKITIFYKPNKPSTAVVERRAPSFFVYLGFLFGLILTLMATGLTFFGDVGGLLYYYEQSKATKEVLSFALVYQNLSDKAFAEKIPEIIEPLPIELKRLLRTVLTANDSLEEAAQIISQYTKWPISQALLLLNGGLREHLKTNFFAKLNKKS